MVRASAEERISRVLTPGFSRCPGTAKTLSCGRSPPPGTVRFSATGSPWRNTSIGAYPSDPPALDTSAVTVSVTCGTSSGSATSNRKVTVPPALNARCDPANRAPCSLTSALASRAGSAEKSA